MVQAINRALEQALGADERVIVMGQDVGKLGGVFRATDGLQARFGPQRVFDTPLAESAIVGTAFGMSLTGLRPVTEIQFMGFMYKCADQLIAQAGQIRARTWGRATAPLVVRTPYGGGVRTPEHHSDSLEGLLIGSPGVEVVDPRTLSPLDWDTLGASVEKTGRLVVAHEAPRTGGPGGELVASLVERCFYALRSPPVRVAGADVVYPPQLLEDDYLPDAR